MQCNCYYLDVNCSVTYMQCNCYYLDVNCSVT